MKSSRHLNWIAGAFACVALSFLAATFFTERIARHIDVDVADLQNNSLPSVERLGNMRTALRDIELGSHLLVDGPAERRESAFERIRHAHAELDADVATYRTIPWYGDERVMLETSLAPRLATLDADVKRLGELVAAGDLVEADALEDGPLATDVDLADIAVQRLSHMNHRHAYAAATHIAELRRRSLRLAVWLEGSAALVALAGAAVAISAASRHARVARQHADLLAARADELESFAQRVSHDLLSPLMAVNVALETIARRDLAGPAADLVTRAQRALARTRVLVSGILDFARSGAKPPPDAHADLGPTIQSAVDAVLASEPAPAPEVKVEPIAPCEVACEPPVLDVIVSNLVSNAAKYSRGLPDRRITVRAKVDDVRAHVEVEDTGPGLAPGLEEKIFHPYARGARTGQPGLGLGLATVKRFVTACGGAVGVRRGRVGCVFWFELPRAAHVGYTGVSPTPA